MATLLALAALPLPTFATTTLRLQIDDIRSPQFALKQIAARMVLDQSTALSLTIGEVRVGERVWRNATLDCPRATVQADLLACEQGTLDVGARYPLAFRYVPSGRQLQVRMAPESGERWETTLNWGAGWQAEIKVTHGALARLNDWLQTVPIALGGGRFDLSARVVGDAQGAQQADARMVVNDAAFTDSAGSRAGEHLSGSAKLHATRAGAWQWQAEIIQQGGEVFWQPFYFPAAARQVNAAGLFDVQALTVQTGTAKLGDIGKLVFSGQWQRANKRLMTLEVQGEKLAFDGLYRSLFKPLLGESVWARFQTSGQLDGKLSLRDGALREVQLNLRNARMLHQGGVLQLDGVQAEIPWRREGGTHARLRTTGGNVRGIVLGPIQAEAALEPGRVEVAPMLVTVLDGALVVDELRFERGPSAKWQWQFAGALRPVSMTRLAEALRWPAMQGTLSGVIPRVTYADRALKVDGALLARVFDGTVVVKHVDATDPLSLASSVRADVDLKNLDLDLLTRQFSFGSISGRLDGEIAGLELSNWQPVAFDARFMSSPGEYPRRISQRAVESISALGGGNASAAIQRTFLRFFDQFGYERIGWQCRLALDVCEMDGIEDLAQGYLIVKGGGIPALSVIGYNRRVGWSDLVDRLRRATQRGVKPVVQ